MKNNILVIYSNSQSTLTQLHKHVSPSVETNSLKVFNTQFMQHDELIVMLSVLCTIIRKHSDTSMVNLLQTQNLTLKLTTYSDKLIGIVKPYT